MRPPEKSTVVLHPGYWLACGLVVIAHLATEIVIGESSGQILPIVGKFFAIAIPFGVFCWLSVRNRWSANAVTTLLALMAMGLPLVVEPVWRWVFQNGHAFEIQLLIGFRNLSLLSLIWAHAPRFERLAVVTSLFTVLFCVTTSQDQSMGWICGLYLVGGVAWLSTTYWSLLKTDRLSGNSSTAPWQMIAAATVLLVGVILTIALPASVRLRMVQGFMPSSGGTGEADPFARSGVGDGDAVVAATEEALTFAPIEDAPFLEGDQPSLYDVYQDTYSPPKPPKKFARAISLPPELFKQNHHRMAQARKASRSFSLDRKQKQSKEHRHLDDTESNALLHLVGPVPAHLRHTVYDLFDGSEWYPAPRRPLHQRALEVESVDGKPWITWADHPHAVTKVRRERHALRVLSVDNNRIVAPANLNGVHIDRCDRPDLFEWAQEDVLAMRRESLPPMTVIHVSSTLLDTRELIQNKAILGFGREEYRAMPEGPGMDEIRELAQKWTVDATCGWEKVAAICENLRASYVHDPDIRVPDGCENPVHWFLTESRRGPDYLFASASVMLCRSLGIASRPVSGLYAGPDQYDYSTRQTSVLPSDAHWWAEVYIGSQSWVTIEPTPGFDVRTFPRGFFATMGIWAWQLGRTALIYWPISLAACCVIVLSVWKRAAILARMRTWWWDWKYDRSEASPGLLRTMMIDTGDLLDTKLRLAETPRPASQTQAMYLKKLMSSAQFAVEDQQLLTRAFDWAAYSEADPEQLGLSFSRLRPICRSLLHDSGPLVTRLRGSVETGQTV